MNTCDKTAHQVSKQLRNVYIQIHTHTNLLDKEQIILLIDSVEPRRGPSSNKHNFYLFTSKKR